MTDFVNKIRQKVNDVLRLFRTRVKLISVLVWHIFIRQNAGRFQKNALRGTPSDLPARGGGGGQLPKKIVQGKIINKSCKSATIKENPSIGQKEILQPQRYQNKKNLA